VFSCAPGLQSATARGPVLILRGPVARGARAWPGL